MFEIVMGIDDFLIQLVKYCMRDNYTVQQLEGIVQNELDALDGVGLKC